MLAKDHDDDNDEPQDSSLTSSSKTAFEKVQLARHNDRPYTIDFISRLFKDFVEIYGDRRFSNDPAIICGFANFHGIPIAIIGHQKGRDTKQRQFRNFGMPKPEGYRKALRIMKLAEKFKRVVLTFIDTPGAYPGIGAEERNQSEAIARNLFVLSQLKTPVICTVIGEGGSGGALAIGVGDRVMMLQYSIYCVISPEGCASILWKSADKAPLAAEAMGLGAWIFCGFFDDILMGAYPDIAKGFGFKCEPLNPKAPAAMGALKIFGLEGVKEGTYVPSPRYKNGAEVMKLMMEEKYGHGATMANDESNWVLTHGGPFKPEVAREIVRPCRARIVSCR